MSERTLKHLKEDWPKRWALKPEEVALVLGRDPSSRGVIQNIREGMSKGNRYPGAQRIDGHWQLPLEALAEILEPSPTTVMVAPKSSKSRRRAIAGPRIRFVINSRFCEAVARAMGEDGIAGELRKGGELVRDELDAQYQAQKAARTQAALDEALESILKGKPETAPKVGRI